MKAVVTGGAGFIGSHLADRLLAGGHEVVAIDNLSTGRMQNLSRQESNESFRFVESSAADYEKIRPEFEGVDWVFHIAGLADIVPSIENPREYFRANCEATVAVLEAARDAGAKRLVYTASSSCYGIPDQYPTPETAEIRPQYPYALTKFMGEECVLHWGQVYDLPVVSLRLFNVFGPRSRTTGAYGAVFGVFLAQKLNGKPYTVVGDGSQTRDFTFVSDVADALAAAAGSDVSGEVFNVGTGQPQSVNRLIELLGGGEIETIPKRPGEPDITHADITKIRDMIGWEPKVSFEEGVQALLSNIKDWSDAPLWTPGSIHEATRAWFQHLSPPEE